MERKSKSANGKSSQNGHKGAVINGNDYSKNGHSGNVDGHLLNGSACNGATNGVTSHDAAQAQAHEGKRCPTLVQRFFNRIFVPVGLMVTTPTWVFLIWYASVHGNGSYLTLFQEQGSLHGGLLHMWRQVNWPTWPIVCIVAGYSLWALALMRLVPGPTAYGPLTPKGNRPQYVDNGFSCFLLTLLALGLLTALTKSAWGVSPTIVYDRFDEVLMILNLFSLAFCLLLYVKGLLAPSTSDSGSSGNVIFDYYWGTELYPRILGFDVKVFTNCRFGMTVWGLLVAIFALKSYELHGAVDSMWVSAALQMIYILKFFWWEAGYMCTIDIMVDRAGYYICWGCLVYIPGLYASPCMTLVKQPVVLGLPLSLLIMSLGLLCIYINYSADMQKLKVRTSQGECLVWGKKPVLIRAKYTLENGDTKESILLASGWWGLARHFHYVFEIGLTVFWSLPALFSTLLPYTYLIWLVLLLTHRSYRDDTKCSKKYGKYWQQYKEAVPYRIVPYLF